MGTLIMLFLHFKMKMTQPMIYSSVSGLIDLWYNPLVQIYLIGKKAEGQFARPFGGASPFGMPPPPGGKAGAGGAADANPLAALLGGLAPPPAPPSSPDAGSE